MTPLYHSLFRVESDVLFAVFVKGTGSDNSTPSTRSALCVYPLEQIERVFLRNIEQCFKGETSKVCFRCLSVPSIILFYIWEGFLLKVLFSFSNTLLVGVKIEEIVFAFYYRIFLGSSLRIVVQRLSILVKRRYVAKMLTASLVVELKLRLELFLFPKMLTLPLLPQTRLLPTQWCLLVQVMEELWR